MSFTSAILEFLFDPQILSTLFVLLISLYIARFYWIVYTLPPGPFPLPFIGNILQLRKGDPLYIKGMKWCKKYGDPFTVFVGEKPMVLVNTKESFKEVGGQYRNVLGGRMRTTLGDLESRGYDDIVFGDLTPAWDVLRRLIHVAIRKYAQTERLSEVCNGFVDQIVEEKLMGGKTVDVEITSYVVDVIFNVLAISCFGGTFKSGDPEFEMMKEAHSAFEREASNGVPSDLMPVLKYVFWKQEAAAKAAVEAFMVVPDKMFAQAMSTYVSGKQRHFTDALLFQREQFLAEDRASAKYLTDENLRQSVIDIFGAGIGTSRTVLTIAFTRLAYDPELQEKLRADILELLGERPALTEDRVKLPLIDSFISEVIRYYPPVPLALPRRALADVTINGRHIPKETVVLTNLYSVNMDKTTYGDDASEFRADRFMVKTKNQTSTSFGIGARSCPGEKMAQADVFFCLVRTLQKCRIQHPVSPQHVDITSINSDVFIDFNKQILRFEAL